MFPTVVFLCLTAIFTTTTTTTASPWARDAITDSASPIHIIRPPVRCPEGMKPDANGRCRVVWDKTLDVSCPAGQRPDADGDCRPPTETPQCIGENCPNTNRLQKRHDGSTDTDDYNPNTHARMEALKTSNRPKKRTNMDDARPGKHARSKHAFLIMLKKKKMQMMKPKPPPPPPHHHHPPHHEESEEPPEEEPAEEDTPAPERLFFGDDACIDPANTTGECPPPGVQVVRNSEPDHFEEWKPAKSSESSESSDSSSESDSTGESDSDSESESESESDSESGSEAEDEVLQKALKIKLMKIFRMKQRYGPALRRWLVTQLKDYQNRKEKKEIISTRCLEAVKETMEVIKDNLEVDGLFTTSGNLRTRKKIQSYLSRGDIYTLRNWGFEFVVECAAALKIFLQNLPQPLIPTRIQQLVVAENSGVPEKTIANDALGLLKEEVNGRHKELLLEVFTFLKDAAVKVNTSELTGCNLPLKLLPVFFDIESNDPQKFRHIATVFHEIIMEAPEHLKTPCRKIPSGELKIIERILSQDMRMASGPLVDPRNGRNQPTGENAEWRIPLPRVPHTRLHPWLGRIEHSTSA